MHEVYAQHLIEFFEGNDDIKTCKKVILEAVINAGKEHVGYGIVNSINQRAETQNQNGKKLALALFFDDEATIDDCYQTLFSICHYAQKNDPREIKSHWNISKSMFSYSSYNTIVIRNILLKTGILDVLYSEGVIKRSDSKNTKYQTIELFSQETFEYIMQHANISLYDDEDLIIIEQKSNQEPEHLMFARNDRSPEIISPDYE
ncbi:hypothetical protein L3V83_11435 [Thiotrichales bacterium 19X7-9]|nr:hypothetical protein [Thiotrichales bacterium 19X7-9]